MDDKSKQEFANSPQGQQLLKETAQYAMTIMATAEKIYIKRLECVDFFRKPDPDVAKRFAKEALSTAELFAEECKEFGRCMLESIFDNLEVEKESDDGEKATE